MKRLEKKSITFGELKNKNHEKKLMKLRALVNRLYYEDYMTKREIAKKQKMSFNFVLKWTQKKDMNFTIDKRGWAKGKRRKWNKLTEKRIAMLHSYLTQTQEEFYTGATAINLAWREKYPGQVAPPLRTIGQILKDLGLSEQHKKRKGKGAAKYLCYPEYCIHHHMGTRVLELDFIGKKFITGRTAPLNFIGFSFKYPPKLRYFERTEGETANEIIKYSKQFFETFEKPDAVKMDNGFAMAGSPPHPRVISKAPLWLLKQCVVPIYAVPRKPFSQASIEGNNSVFSRNFWNKIQFDSVEHVDRILPLFNNSSLRYTGYNSIEKENDKENAILKFIPKICFIRQVIEKDQKAIIELVNEKVELPTDFINYFVFAEWDLLSESLFISIEKDQKAELITKIDFKINKISKEKLQNLHII